MLNQGRPALEQYAATIDTQMAQAADKFNDALNAVARSIAGTIEPSDHSIAAIYHAASAGAGWSVRNGLPDCLLLCKTSWQLWPV
jgi:hypothetical protein